MQKRIPLVMTTLALSALLTAVRTKADPGSASSTVEQRDAKAGKDDHSAHVRWVAKCLREIQKIKPGMTKGDLLKVFAEGGGLSSPTTQTFVHLECPLIQVDVTFETGPAADRDKAKIATISKPYLEWPIDD